MICLFYALPSTVAAAHQGFRKDRDSKRDTKLSK